MANMLELLLHHVLGVHIQIASGRCAEIAAAPDAGIKFYELAAGDSYRDRTRIKVIIVGGKGHSAIRLVIRGLNGNVGWQAGGVYS